MKEVLGLDTKYVLVVNQVPGMTWLLKRSLGASDRHIVVAENTDTAAAMMESVDFDLVISDITQEQMDGFESMCNTWRTNGNGQMIMFSSFGKLEVTSRARNLGVERFLTKPFRVEHLQDEVARVLTTLTQPEAIPAMAN